MKSLKNKSRIVLLSTFIIFGNIQLTQAQNLTPFELNKKWGFKDENGKVVVPAKYDEFMNFSGYFSTGLQSARIGQKWTFIDRSGKEVIPFKYNLTHDFSEGLVAVNIGACCHDVEYTAPMGGKWGYINKAGVVIIPIVYDYVGDFKEGLSYVTKYNTKDEMTSGSKSALINKSGKQLTAFKYDNDLIINGGLICASANDKFGFLDKTGKEVIALIYDNAYDFSEGLAAVKKGDKWGFIDNTGKIIIPIEYENNNYMYGFVEGSSPAKKNGKFGFIDKTGKEITPFEFDDMGEFNQERVAVKRGDKWGFVGRKGNTIVEIKYDKVKNTGYNGLKITTGFREGNEYSLDSTGKETFVRETEKPKAKQTETVKTNSPKTEIKPVVVSIDRLFNAIDKGNLKEAESLINKGVDLKATGGVSGRTALQHVCDRFSEEGMDNSDKVSLATLLIKKGSNVNALDDNGETALHFAANRGNLEMVQLLLKNGADPKIKTKTYNVTALDRAKNNKHKEIVEVLKKYK